VCVWRYQEAERRDVGDFLGNEAENEGVVQMRNIACKN